MYAIVETGGKQYCVSEGDTVEVEKISAEPGSEVIFDKVLFFKGDDGVLAGSPYVENCTVTGKVLRQAKRRKIIVFKYKPKKNYRRKRGHRQPFTQVRIEKIACGA